MERDLYHANNMYKESGAATLILDNADLRTIATTRYKEGYSAMTKRPIHQEDTAILNVGVPSNEA